MNRALFARSRVALGHLAARSPSAFARRPGPLLGRAFSGKVGGEDSHSDFAPQSKVTATNDDEVQEFLKEAVSKHDVLLFMKGSPEAPQCGFSAKVVGILKSHSVDFSSADVLSSMEIRQGIKAFSDWPTVPQLYLNGEFIGGCDIVEELETSGDLAEMLTPIKEKQQQDKQS